MKRLLLFVTGVLLLLQPGSLTTAQTSDALTFFKNYFITGDYVVGGTSLWRQGVDGVVTKDIVMNGVPEGVDVLAAFLYVQTAEIGQGSGIDNAKFNGHDFGPGSRSIAKALNWDLATRPCWSVGLAGGRRLVTYRTDVLRFLPIGENGKYVVNGAHSLKVPDSGIAFGESDESAGEAGSGTGPRAIGASLVVVFRDPTRPLRAVVIYDGGFTKPAFASMQQTVRGFYDASATPAARLTHIVGDGRPYLSEKVLFDGRLIATNPFASTAGPKWDNPTQVNLPLGADATSASVEVTPNGLFSDCVSYSAMVLSTGVQDTDGDGLLDIWESSETPILDPNGQPLPNLKAMGANPDHKDVFIELGYMYAEDHPDPDIGPPTYGGVAKPAHTHLPSHEALRLVGESFTNAPVENPDGRPGIALHIDAGNSYPMGEADPYLIRGAGLARGGEAINELTTVCGPGATAAAWVCQFSGHPGTVGWKTGFRFIRDEVLSGPPVPPGGDDPCDAPTSTCTRRFDRNRAETFRYALFAHAIGLPKSAMPCLDAANNPVAASPATDRCDAPLRDNPEFHTPRTNTGVADFPGGDILVTLGAFPDSDGKPVGTPFMQASTLMHEWGHTAELAHGGRPGDPNCKPTYVSVMNYLYQLRGLLDDAGTPHLDFSRDVIDPAVDETSLLDASASLPYRIGWYAPLFGSYLEGRGTAAARHCDGSSLLTTDLPMVRIDARTATGTINWNANGSDVESGYTQDINFNGRTTSTPNGTSPELLRGFDDWANIRLNQVGARRNVGGPFFDSDGRQVLGPLSLDMGRWDFGRWDFAQADLGRWDFGAGDLGRGDLGQGDYGRWDFGRWDFGRWDFGQPEYGRGDDARGYLGGGDLFVGDPDNAGGELDFETASDLAKTPPNTFGACIIGVDCVGVPSPNHRVRASWTPTNVGGVLQYAVYRVDGPALLPGQPWTLVATVDSVPGQEDYSVVDGSQLTNGAQYTYFTVAIYSDTLSDPSNLVTITAVNDPPVAGNDSYSTTEDSALSQPAPGVLANDADADSDGSLAAALITGPAHGTVVLNANGSFTYTPAANYHGPDTFTYKASDGMADSAPATVLLTVSAVNDPPAAVADSYTTAEDTPLNPAAPGVLSNDTDIDGDTLTAELVGTTSHGTIALRADGSFTYTPTGNYNGPDAFSYRARDTTGGYSASTSVNITVTAVNDAPTAISDSYNIDQGTVLNIATPGVLGNDTDEEHQTLTAVLGSGPMNGTLTLNANGSFTYTPTLTFTGLDSFTYRAKDGSALSAPATVSITVKAVGYALVNVKNLPPAPGVTFKPSSKGTLVDFEWKFAKNGIVVNSADAQPSVTIQSPSGVITTFTPANCSAAGIKFEYKADSKLWDFHWTPKNAAVGTYYVIVYSGKTGQRFPATGLGFPVIFKN